MSIVKCATSSHSRLAVMFVAMLMLLAVAPAPWNASPVWAQDGADSGDDVPAAKAEPDEIDLIDLIWKGGFLMIPIGAMSIVVAIFAIERGLGLTRRKVIPSELVEGLGELAGTQGGFDPRKAYRLCQAHPSAAATVIRAMLLKVGRPHSEVEHAVADANEREAARIYGNVRFLNLAAAVTPLMGLMGTVWGMIDAFFKTAKMTADQNKSELLAEGIYVALVTTFGGLAVAIPAAILAHFFEGRIQALFREIDELLLSLLPQIERYEGRLRVSRQQLSGEDGGGEPKTAELVEK